MSILHSSNTAWYISHEDFLNTFYVKVETDGGPQRYQVKNNLFKILSPFKDLNNPNTRRKRKRIVEVQDPDLLQSIEHVKQLYKQLRIEISHLSSSETPHYSRTANRDALELSTEIYKESGYPTIINSIGENQDEAKLVKLQNHKFIFPSNCKFYCKNVVEIGDYLIHTQYDLILLDPPWWNKYIRRKKAKTNDGYQMMFNDDIKELPIASLLSDNGLVVVWCTNSRQHLNAIENTFFPKWDVTFAAKWFWLKITQSGEPVCNFSEPPGKQPFEQIVIGSRNPATGLNLLNEKLVASVPSALHSHKPPLINLLSEFLPQQPNCLEIFARYLLPNWTSWGLEAIRFQHESLYKQC